MVDLPKKKVGIVSCSGEELPEGTITRLATLKVLEHLRPTDTVTICLPLFLAGGEGDRAFAKFYPTIAVDGCPLRCAARGTEMYSSKPAASIVVSELVEQNGLEKPQGLRRLDKAGKQAVDLVADQLAAKVDELLGKHWNRRAGEFEEPVLNQPDAADESKVAACSCGSGILVQKVHIHGRAVSLIALPALMQQFMESGKEPSNGTIQELLEQIKIYNPVPAAEEKDYLSVLEQEYRADLAKENIG